MLRDRIAEAHAVHAEAAEALITPYRPTERFTPMPRRAMLDRLGRRWRALPAFGRLRLIVKYAGGKLQIAEVRTAPSQIAMDDWSEGELAVAIALKMIVIEPPRFVETSVMLAVVGLHAVARRYERGADRTDDAALHDLEPLARSWRDTIGGGEFQIPATAGSGKWIGAVMMAGEAPTMVVRTYVG